MDSKVRDKLLIIASIFFAVATFVFLALSMFAKPKNTMYLPIALACCTLSNVCNIARNRLNEKESKK